MSFSRPGAVDLSGLAEPTADGTSDVGGRWAFDVTDQNFQSDVLQASMRYIVVLHLWSPRSPQSEAFNHVLSRVVDGYDGRLTLGRVDVDANPAIAQALGAQAVPLAVAILSGQPVPLFQGTLGDDEVRQYFDQLVTAAVQNGVTGRAEPTGDAGAPAGSQSPTKHSPTTILTLPSPNTNDFRPSTQVTTRSPSVSPVFASSPALEVPTSTRRATQPPRRRTT
jgi:putative thioredoxin